MRVFSNQWEILGCLFVIIACNLRPKPPQSKGLKVAFSSEGEGQRIAVVLAKDTLKLNGNSLSSRIAKPVGGKVSAAQFRGGKDTLSKGEVKSSHLHSL